jgi:hypothetical protein
MSLTRPLTATGSITTNTPGAGNTVTLSGAHAYDAAAVQITGTWTGTVTFEGSVDGVNFVAMAATPLIGGATASTATAVGAWRCNLAGLVAMRVRGSAAMTGAAVVTIVAASIGSGGV